jgi:hypothetical protein
LAADYSRTDRIETGIEQRKEIRRNYAPGSIFAPSIRTEKLLKTTTEQAGLATHLPNAPPHTHTMGFFSSSSDKLPAPKISTDGTPIAPDRSARAKCWEARDAYFQCLDKNTIIDSLTNKDAAEKACGTENKGFEKNCASSWVSFLRYYFCFWGGGRATGGEEVERDTGIGFVRTLWLITG